MRRELVAVAVAAAGLAAGLAAVAVVAPVSTERLVDVYVLLVGALLLFSLVRATGATGGRGVRSAFDRALRAPRPPTRRPAELESLERTVTLAATSAFDLHVRLRPVLREIAEHRLAASRGLRLDSASPDVRQALGHELWELVRPDRPPPEDRFAAGIAAERLRRHVRALESI